MANDYSSALEIFKDLQRNGATDANYTTAAPMMSDTTVSSDIDSLNEKVFGAASESLDQGMAGQKILNQVLHEVKTGQLSEETQERLKANLRTSKLDPAIIQSFLSNPLINENVGGDDIDAFMQKNIQKNKNIMASQQINEKLEARDAKKIQEQQKLNPKPQVTAPAVDMNELAALMESIIDKKLGEYFAKTRQLTESQARQMPSPSAVKAVQLKEDGSFLMVDSEDNVYECRLTYKGKNKRKQK